MHAWYDMLLGCDATAQIDKHGGRALGQHRRTGNLSTMDDIIDYITGAP